MARLLSGLLLTSAADSWRALARCVGERFGSVVGQRMSAPCPCVIALAVVFGRSAVGFGSALVMFGCFVVFVSSHWLSPAMLGDAYEN
jgi:hypothetical protein